MTGVTPVLVAGSMVGLALVPPSASAQNYVLQDLSFYIDYSAPAAYDVNDSGRIVGNETYGASSAFRSGVNGVGREFMGTFGGANSAAKAINAAGDVTGEAQQANGAYRAYRWTAATGLQSLGTLGGNYSIGTGINNAGDVAGMTTNSAGALRAFRWNQSTGMQDLGTLGGSDSSAEDINASGQVVGTASLNGDATSHAFRWTPGSGMKDLGTLGGPGSEARGINSAGDVVGSSYATNFPSPITHAFRWSSATGMIDLGTLTSGATTFVNHYANDINDYGQIVGNCDVPFGPATTFLNAGGRMYDLKALARTEISQAYAINGNGAIAVATPSGAGVLQPVLLQWFGTGGADTRWSTAANWGTGTVPIDVNPVRFQRTSQTYSVSFDVSPTVMSMDTSWNNVTFALGGHTFTVLKDAVLGNPLGGFDPTLHVSDGTFTVNRDVYVGQYSNTTLSVEPRGAVSVGHNLYIGCPSNALFSGTVNISGLKSHLVVAGRMVVGQETGGVVNVSNGGRVDVAEVTNDGRNGHFSAINVTNGTLTSNLFMDVGGTVGNASLTVNPGGVVNANWYGLTVWNHPNTSVNLNGGTINTTRLNTDGNPNNFHWNSGTLNVTGGGPFLLAPGAALGPALNLTAGKTLQVSSGPLVVGSGGSVSIDAGGKLDLTNQSAVFASGASVSTGASATAFPTTYTGVSALVASGRNGRAWNGSGIVTSQTDATNSGLTSLGVATAAEVTGIGAAQTTVWAGQTVTGTDTLVKYTYAGDANLDGKIDVLDYGRIDLNVPLGVSGWFNGDFNYDGKIDVLDYGIIDFNVAVQGPALPTTITTLPGIAGTQAVPEPTAALLLLALPTLGLSRRRRAWRC